MSATAPAPPSPDGFRHEALFYRGLDDFVRRAERFVRDGLAGGETVLVAAPPARIDGLRAALGADAERVVLTDMTAVGANPTRIIPVWYDLLAAHAGDGRPVRAIGEPLWAHRPGDEVEDCHLHEALLNRALSDRSRCWLVCPYDANALPPADLARARCTHPHVWEGETHAASDRFDAGTDVELFARALPAPPPEAEQFDFGPSDISRLRALVSACAADFGLAHHRVGDLAFAVHELAANSIRHGGGAGRLRVWREGSTLVCEVRDRGVVADPLVGRRPPDFHSPNGRGLWLVNQLSDFLQIRSSADGTAVRVRMSRAAGGQPPAHGDPGRGQAWRTSARASRRERPRRR